MESKLGFAKRLDRIRDHLQQIIECAESINAYNLDHGLSREITRPPCASNRSRWTSSNKQRVFYGI